MPRRGTSRLKRSALPLHRRVRALFAWQSDIQVDLSEEQSMRMNLNEYKALLRMQDGTILPDPFTLKEMDWLGESACVKWPSLYFIDINTYLKMKTADVLYHRLCNEYKQGAFLLLRRHCSLSRCLWHLLTPCPKLISGSRWMCEGLLLMKCRVIKFRSHCSIFCLGIGIACIMWKQNVQYIHFW